MPGMASFISRASTFLPRYSGVRPTIRPARKTPMMRYTRRLMRPTPTPPQMQLSHMPVSGVSPASGFRLSCMQLTDPLEVFVVRPPT